MRPVAALALGLLVGCTCGRQKDEAAEATAAEATAAEAATKRRWTTSASV